MDDEPAADNNLDPKDEKYQPPPDPDCCQYKQIEDSKKDAKAEGLADNKNVAEPIATMTSHK